MQRSHHSRDPHWITARFDGKDANGVTIRKGDAVFYYPSTKRCFAGEAAAQAARDFEAARFDEEFGGVS